VLPCGAGLLSVVASVVFTGSSAISYLLRTYLFIKGLAAVHPDFYLTPAGFTFTAVITPPELSLYGHCVAFVLRDLSRFIACRP